MRITPLAYQREGVEDMEDFLRIGGGTLLGDDMGLGKTLETLWLLKRQRAGPMFPALVVCPASIKGSWEWNAHEHVHISSQVLDGRTTLGGGFGSSLPPLTIINPDILSDWLPVLSQVGYKTIVLDECQAFGNPVAKRTRAAIALARKTPYRLALSGTPLMNGPGELWPTLYMLRPDVFGSLFSFASEYCCLKREYGRWTYRGARNLDKLHTLLRRTCMVRRTKEDVLGELNKTRFVVPMDVTDMAEYKHAATDFVGWLRKNYWDDKGKVRRAMRAAAVTRVGYLVRLASRLKARAVVGWANRFLVEHPGEKLVLFCVHTKMLELLARRINSKCVAVDGSVTGRRRLLAVEQFRKDKNIRVFVGNVRATGIGIDGLQDACNNVAFAELWWVPGVHVQAEDRLVRMGQKNPVWINYLIAVGTIEEHLCEIIQNKQQVIHATLDGAAYRGDMNVFDQLIAILEAEDGNAGNLTKV